MNEILFDDYAFKELDPFVRTVFSELMEHPERMRVIDREHCVRRPSGSMKDLARLISVC